MNRHSSVVFGWRIQFMLLFFVVFTNNRVINTGLNNLRWHADSHQVLFFSLSSYQRNGGVIIVAVA